jgi:hypothetical protein
MEFTSDKIWNLIGDFQSYEMKQIFQMHISKNLTLLSILNLRKTCKWFHTALEKDKKLKRKEIFEKLSKAKQFWLYLGKWGEDDLINLCLSKIDNSPEFRGYLGWGLASCGHQKLFKTYFKSNEIDRNLLINGALYGAARYGDNSFVEYLLSSIGNPILIDDEMINQIIFGYIKNGNTAMIKFWAEKVNWLSSNAFRVAGETGNKNIVKFLDTLPQIKIQEIKNPFNTDEKIRQIVQGYSKGGHLELVKETFEILKSSNGPGFTLLIQNYLTIGLYGAVWGKCD